MSKVNEIASNWAADMRKNREPVYGAKWGGEQLLRDLDDILSDGDIYGDVYEIGCGGGRLTKRLFQWGAERVFASDVHSQALQKTKLHEPRANVVLSDGESIEGSDYDVIFTWGVLLHLPVYLVQQYMITAMLAGDSFIFGLPTFELPNGKRSYDLFLKNKAWRNPYFTGYFHHYTKAQVLSMLNYAGWSDIKTYSVFETHILYICK